MEEKEQNILNAAKSVFFKFGYTKTTMNDIAEAAGISRPGLYLIFSKKEDIFNALILSLSNELSKEVITKISKLKDPRSKLMKVLDVWVVQIHTLLNQSSEVKELYDNQFAFAKESMKKSTSIFEADLENALKSFPSTSFNNNAKPHDVAHIISSAVLGFKKNSDDLKELKENIELLINVCIKA